MLKADKDLFICDMAEFYHIYDYKAFKPTYIATLASGLPDNSRIKKSIANTRISLEEMLLAQMVDALNTLCWMKTKDAQNGWNRPKSLFKALTSTETQSEIQTFDSSDDFEMAFAAIVGE